MNQSIKNKKLVYPLVTCCLLLLLAGGYYIYRLHQETQLVDHKVTNNKKIITNSYYTLNLPPSWALSGNSDLEKSLYFKKKKIGTLTTNPKCDYCSSTELIVDSWLGMHALIEKEFSFLTKDSYSVTKDWITYEPSAAEHEKEISYPKELHYFYTNHSDCFLDLSLDYKQLSEKEADSLAKCLTMK